MPVVQMDELMRSLKTQLKSSELVDVKYIVTDLKAKDPKSWKTPGMKLNMQLQVKSISKLHVRFFP